ncbi:hypothetical protein ACS0TY_018144 [Phlomoides rotata]
MKKQFYGGRGVLIEENPVLKSLLYNQHISIDWTSEEQSIFEYLLEKYATEIPIIRYARIAQALPKKSIRDVTFRSVWMRENGKRKSDDISGNKSIVGQSCGSLIEFNAQMLDQIDSNFSDLKIHENINLLNQTRENIHTIVEDLPKIYEDIIPPFKINEDRANFVLPSPDPPK